MVTVWRRGLPALVLVLLGLSGTAAGAGTKCKIFSLKLENLTTVDGQPAPPCTLDEMLVNDFNGVTYHKADSPLGDSSFKLGKHITASQHSGPWFIHEALKRGDVVADMESADRIFVDDFCYYTWWLAWEPSTPDLIHYAGDDMITMYKALTELPRWKRNGGADFVFFAPHPGVDYGRAHHDYVEFICKTFRKSVFVVVEHLQRLVCGDTDQEAMGNKAIVAPYTSNNKFQVKPLPALDVIQKPGFIFYKGRCSPPEEAPSEGTAFRYNVIAPLRSAPNVTIDCSSRSPTRHARLIAKMSRHKFCLVLPGDSSSSRRLTDAMVAKCLPVFVGPPFHSLAFTRVVDYTKFGIFINVTASVQSPFLTGDRKGEPVQYIWQPDWSKGPWWLGQSEWWVPSIDVSKVVYTAADFSDVLNVLRNLPEDVLRSKQQHLEEASEWFRYQPNLDAEKSATRAILDQACEH